MEFDERQPISLILQKTESPANKIRYTMYLVVRLCAH